MEETKFMYVLGTVALVLVTILRVSWGVACALLSVLFTLVSFFTLGLLFGSVVGGVGHHHD